MNRTEARVEELLGILPDVEELEVLRLRLIGSAVPDPERAWTSGRATVDKHILTPEDVERSIGEAEEALRAYVTALHDGLRPVMRSFFAGDIEAAARHLVSLGEQHEEGGRAKSARACYRRALQISLPLADKGAQILALRRIGRVSISLGDFQEAASHYERSAQLARDAEDVHAEVVALTGFGNVFLWQGRWAEAERSYLHALARAEDAPEGTLELERGQIYNNLANLTTRGERLEEAEGWFARALDTWGRLSSPVDLAVCCLNVAHLREAQGRRAEAREMYEEAMKIPVSPGLRVGIVTDLAELSLQEGHVSQAEEWGRLAEEHAIASGSPYALGRMYQGRGNIARAQEDDDGFTFYEKALEIAREKGYLFLEGETLLDYAELRLKSGGEEEALAYAERAREIFVELGAVQDLARAERMMARVARSEPPVAAD